MPVHGRDCRPHHFYLAPLAQAEVIMGAINDVFIINIGRDWSTGPWSFTSSYISGLTRITDIHTSTIY